MSYKVDISRLPTKARINDPATLKVFQDRTANGFYALIPSEKWWRDCYYVLERHGYQLRQRYHPDWTPSWLGTNIVPEYCEDSLIHFIKPVMDAVRIKDGVRVAIKYTSATAGEVQISKYLSSPEMSAKEDNHCVPILDEFHDEDVPDKHFIVMPLLRRFDDPPFDSVMEVLEFIEQTLRGIVFLHEHDIAHRDCANKNIMMDGDALYPEGFHPSQQDLVPSLLGKAKRLRRVDVASVKYYFVDFGLSNWFVNKDIPRLVLGDNGLDQEVPELHWESTRAYDPFCVDIFILGNLYRKTFLNEYDNMKFIKPLTDAMTQKDPNARPTAAGALGMFHSIVAKRSEISRRWRLQGKSEFLLARLFRDLNHSLNEALYLGKRFLPATGPFK